MDQLERRNVTAVALRAENLSKRFGALRVVDDVSFSLQYGRIVALIGPNGAGKTSLMNVLSGVLPPDSGRVFFDGVDVTARDLAERSRAGLARTFQIATILPESTVLANVALAVQAKCGSSFRFFAAAAREEGLNEPARVALARVNLADRAAMPAGALSHGEKRRLELAIALAMQPRILLLDEPFAGLGPEETAESVALVGALARDHAILLVEHDMDAVFALADEIGVLDRGRLIAWGPPEAIRADATVRAAYLGEAAPC
jgi:branched-chain amino acid transport system ATP-binding protein